jgi:hypothetical protein
MRADRFPPPWSIEEQAACFIVGDRSGQALAYVYFENEPGRRRDVTRREPDRLSDLCRPIAKSVSWNRCSDWWQPNSLAALRKAFTTSSGLESFVFAIVIAPAQKYHPRSNSSTVIF